MYVTVLYYILFIKIIFEVLSILHKVVQQWISEFSENKDISELNTTRKGGIGRK